VLDWSLLSGPVPVVLRLGALAAGLWLVWLTLLRRRRGWWPAVGELSACLLVTPLATVLLDHLARDVWMVFPDRLDLAIYLWVGLALFAMCLALIRIVSERGVRRGVVVVTGAVVIVAACANQINAAYGAYLTPRDALGMTRYDDIALRDTKVDGRLLPDVDPVSSRWQSPAGLPVRGKVTSAPIPGPTSGFTARNAEIYLPPAYFADPRPRLPVLVLLAGQPGRPQDWLGAGKLARIMDRFAAHHDGLAPVVVVADDTGSRFANPLCLDSRRGNADTYLARDVPTWIRTHLDVDADSQAWALAGVSYLRATAGHQPSRRVPHISRHLRLRRTHPGRPGAHRHSSVRDRSRRVCPSESARSSSCPPLPGQRRRDRRRDRRRRHQTRCPPGVPGDDGGRNGQPLHRSPGFPRLARLFRRADPRAALAGAANGPHRLSGVIAHRHTWLSPAFIGVEEARGVGGLQDESSDGA
jgi:hypothetical protein